MEKNFNLPILQLGPDFFDDVVAARFPAATCRYRNDDAAKFLGLGSLSAEEWQRYFWQFLPMPQNLKNPLALRYHGHQFGTYNPDLGDGRGFLYAQIWAGNQIWDLGTKGSGTTPYSRRGDGRLTLKGALREILCTEYLQSMGVNTSRTFSVFETGESLERNDEPSPTRAAVLVRLCRGHIRIGTFQRLAFLQDAENILKLVRYCVKYYYPETPDLVDAGLVPHFLKLVCQRCAKLAAQYMLAGFVHGVLNTDNINISGESFDYGPYRFLPFYDLDFTAAYFDREGYYSYGRQPVSFLWNLQQLGSSLSVAHPGLQVDDILESYGETFNSETRRLFLDRLGLKSRSDEVNDQLMQTFFKFLESKKVPFADAFFDLYGGVASFRWKNSPHAPIYANDLKLMQAFADFEPAHPDRLAHPYFLGTKPQTLLIDEIESIWKDISEKNDWQKFEEKLLSLRSFRGLYGQ